MIGATRAAIDALDAGFTPEVWAPWPGPLEEPAIYNALVWEAFVAEFPEFGEAS